MERRLGLGGRRCVTTVRMVGVQSDCRGRLVSIGGRGVRVGFEYSQSRFCPKLHHIFSMYGLDTESISAFEHDPPSYRSTSKSLQA